MNYKALILDLDGTTIPNTPDGMPTRGVISAIAHASKVIHISIATGRPKYRTEAILKALSLSGPCILSNGTQLYDPKKQKMLQEKILPRSVIPNVFKLLNRHDGVIYIFDGVTEQLFHGESVPGRTLSLFMERLTPDAASEIENGIAGIPELASHKIVSWEKGYQCIEVTHRDATKLHGIVEIAKILGIETHEMIGVGDGYNDFPLLMACGLKIAMGNAVPELKAIADFIAPSVDQDGVKTIIEKFVLT
ncbi:MAG: HAD family hydrolase [bacterium]|nr:HAD family hydrolase [bacterium]